MTTFLVQRTKLIRQVEIISVDAYDEEDAKIKLAELSDPVPVEEVIDERTELLAAALCCEVAA